MLRSRKLTLDRVSTRSGRSSSFSLRTAKRHAGARGSRDKITFLIGDVAFHHANGAALFDYASCCSQSRVLQLDRERLSPLREDESKNKVLWKVDADPVAGKTPIENLDKIEYRKVPKGFIEEGLSLRRSALILIL